MPNILIVMFEKLLGIVDLVPDQCWHITSTIILILQYYSILLHPWDRMVTSAIYGDYNYENNYEYCQTPG